MFKRLLYLNCWTAILLVGTFFMPSTSAALARKNVVILPPAVYSAKPKHFIGRAFKTMLMSRLSGESIHIVGDEQLSQVLSPGEKNEVFSPQRAQDLGSALGADYVIFGSITSVATSYSLDFSILDLTKKEPELKRKYYTVEENQLIQKLSDIALDFRAIITGVDISAPGKQDVPSTLLQAPGPTESALRTEAPESSRLRPSGSARVRTDVVGFDIGDLNGDGNPELVVIGRKDLLIYNRSGRLLVLKDTLKASFGEEFIKVSVGDGNGDGRAEIYVVSAVGLRARSSVWQWSGKLEKVLETSGHVQIVKSRLMKPMVLYQKSPVKRFFGGRIRVVEYSNPNKLTEKRSLPEFHTGIQFYTLAFTPFEQCLGLNQDDYLCLWDKQGSLVWQSHNAVGGTNNAITLGETLGGDFPNIVYFNNRIVSGDIDNDGKREILLVDNIRMVENLQTFRRIVNSRLKVYRLQGGILHPLLTIPNIPYCVMDIQVQDKTLYLACQKGHSKLLGRNSGRIMWFDLGKQQ